MKEKIDLFEISEETASEQGDRFLRLWTLYQRMKKTGQLNNLFDEAFDELGIEKARPRGRPKKKEFYD